MSDIFLLKLKIHFPLKMWFCLMNQYIAHIYKSKYDIASFKEKAHHLCHGENLDLTKNVFVPEKIMLFPWLSGLSQVLCLV